MVRESQVLCDCGSGTIPYPRFLFQSSPPTNTPQQWRSCETKLANSRLSASNLGGIEYNNFRDIEHITKFGRDTTKQNFGASGRDRSMAGGKLVVEETAAERK